ncbi:Zinc finger, double-stranded RNA binding,DnaJ domain, conserved site,Zinc finger C2H2-type,DnaJ [Cinara cedri]|uniref:DnaJ homolog subfamily C member 21 n=1 Tax=Cinara cedri TaxID=506608 RepID=A0A5E4LXF3_9HEMI|nr:Zinc finger, double-stranded RNA binding,DnaJ domain, conserved site,Zinc finger C2H2-type,DnaJ [Cinara cedri]
MKCFYQVLEVPCDASFDDLKKSYKKLALKWHPDKNPDNVEESKEQFQLIQQAYEVLSDPRERQWYDNHREHIINSGDTPVDELNLFKYFSPSCYKGFGDDEKGFYTVYREVFSNIFIEESVYYHGDSDVIPTFGRSDSDFVEIVRPFYNFWCGFNTYKTFAWLDEYDIRQAPNRRVAKLMEKENKKIRDKAKKERNDEIQALIEYVRKRDKRVKAYSEYLKLKSAENNKRMEEARQRRLKEKQKEMANYKESDWSKFSNVEEELKVIEDSLIAEYGSSDELESGDETANCLYCVACNKVFKTEKAFQNHEKSKKHKDNIELIKVEMLDDEDLLNNIESVENNNVSEDNCQNHSDAESAVDDNAFKDDDENHSDAESSIDEINFDGSDSNKESSNSSSNETDEIEFNTNKSKNTNRLNLQSDIHSDDILEADLSSEEETKNIRKKPKKKKKSLSTDEVNVLYCLSCDQSFKTEKALSNHKTSKKHNDKVVLLSAKHSNDDDHRHVCESTETHPVTEVDTEEVPKENQPQKEATIEKSPKNKKKQKIMENPKIKKSNHVCGICSSVFSSKNKLHQHIKDSNHAVLKNVKESRHKKKGK